MTARPAGRKNRPRKKPLPARPAGKGRKAHNRLALEGQVFGRLTVLQPTDDRAANGCVIWQCRCQCGTDCLVAAHNLRSGNTLSCGCLQVEKSSVPNSGRCH